MKALEILQPAAFGDILFIQKLCKVLSEQYEVYHNINPMFWDRGADQLETNVNFGPNLSIPNERFVYDCSAHMKEPKDLMTSKYEGIGIEWEDWTDYLKYRRYPEREHGLRQHFGIEKGDPFILANRTYSFHKTHEGVRDTIPSDYDGKIIWIEPNLTQKIFDWCWLFENAEQIHTVDTSIMFIIDTLNTTDKLYCHPRHWQNTKRAVERVFDSSWSWVDYTEESIRGKCTG